MSDKEALILLNMVVGLGPRSIFRLLKEVSPIAAVFSLKLKELAGIVGLRLAEAIKEMSSSDEFSQEIELIRKENINIITLLDSEYPRLLKEIHTPPIVLYLKGSVDVLSWDRKISIIGSRKASGSGLSLARKFAFSLAEKGFCIVSGFARGIDTAAHKGALAACGKTIAVLGSGLLCVYPPENKSFVEDVAHNGCLLSEFSLRAKPSRENFPRRNRIISGLSASLLVVEAAKRSGALITANFALEQGRDVFCLPGDVNSSFSQGTNHLIKEGAMLVDTPEDIMSGVSI